MSLRGHRRAGLRALLAALSAGALGPLCAQSGPEAKLSGLTLRVGWDAYPPFQVEQPGSPDQPGGLDVELLTLWARELGAQLLWRRAPWARQLLDASQGDLDLVLSATPTTERRQFAEFTAAYRRERVALLALADGAESVSRLTDLKGKPVQIGVIRGSAFPADLERELNDPVIRRLLLPLRANDLTLAMLRARRVDYVLDDPVTVMHRAAGQPGPALKVAWAFPDSPVHVLVSKQTLARHPGLMAQMDNALRRARAGSAWAQVMSRYPGS